MPEPASRKEIDKALAEWDALLPAGEDPRYLVGDTEDRAALIKGMRELADFLEARPDIPAPRRSDCGTVFVNGTIAGKRAQIDHAARLLGAPVTDNTARGGHYSVTRSFGPVVYEMIATRVGAPDYAVGADVRLASEAVGVAKAAGLAQAGYVTEVTEEREGEYSFTVHFPGRAGTHRGWAETLLRRAWFEPISLTTGDVSSIREAEELLIELGAQAELPRRESGPAGLRPDEDRDKLCRELAAACGMEPADLARQMAPQIQQRVREHLNANTMERRETAPELAGTDEQHAAAAVDATPVQGGDQQTPAKTATPLRRGGRRP